MESVTQKLGTYLHLARAAEIRRQLLARDRLLVLSGVIAHHMKLAKIAAYCRHKILEHNPQHIVNRWAGMGEALDTEDFDYYVQRLWRRYPFEKAEGMLQSLGIQLGNERESYYTDHEYAAAILGTSPEKLDELFRDDFTH